MLDLTTKPVIARIKATIIWLKEKFPQTFVEPSLPLKIGIHQDLFALNLADAPPKRIIRKALSFYANAHSYLNALVKKTQSVLT